MVDKFHKNKGFVAAVNHGLGLAKQIGHHVILLNTDTLLPDGWASRIMAPIIADTTVASVTPVSNTAEIASIPAQGIVSSLTQGQVNCIDQTARSISSELATVELPTGIGFAMAMNRRFLDRIGGFDPAFGRGYGEEVDWCQKARALGGRHLLATNVFIGHRGGASFGTAEKQAGLERSAAILTQRFPDFDEQVRDWANEAPHGAQRIALALAWLGPVSTKAVPIFLGHSLGGGAEFCLQREIDDALQGGAPGVVVLRVGSARNWRIEVLGPGYSLAGQSDSRVMILELLRPIRRRRIVYSCGVAARDPCDVPDMLLALADERPHRLELRVHDHFALTPSYCLLDSRGRYRGVPTMFDSDPAHAPASWGGRAGADLAAWRRRWDKVIDRASSVTTFSGSSRKLFVAAYPSSAAKLRHTPHTLPADLPPLADRQGPKIGVLGSINHAKGARVLEEMCRHLGRDGGSRRVVLIGELDPDFRLPRPHLVTGRYDRADITMLAMKHGIGLWLIPSIWPETFSFTSHEALATGLPVLTFDLGAQASAVQNAPNGHVLGAGPSDIPGVSEEIENIFSEPRTLIALRDRDLRRIA